MQIINSYRRHIKAFDMAIFGSSEENDIDNKGQIQNSISIGETVTTYGNELVILLAIISGIKIFEVMMYAYRTFRRSLKKTLSRRSDAADNV